MTPFTSLPQPSLEELRALRRRGPLPVSPEFQAFLERAETKQDAIETVLQRSAADSYWQTQRSSMIHEVAKGGSCWTGVDFVACDLPEATAIRAALYVILAMRGVYRGRSARRLATRARSFRPSCSMN
jgi:hypothetical protein